MNSDRNTAESRRIAIRDSYSGAGIHSHPNDVEHRGRDRRSPGDATLVADRESARAAYDEYRAWIRATLKLPPEARIRCNWINDRAYAYVRVSPDGPEQRYRIGDDGTFTAVGPDPYLYPETGASS
jgi:hypothetical protein